MKIVRIKSDNYNCYMRETVYNEVRLQMSTGDFHTHRVKHLEISSYKIHSLKIKDLWFEPEEVELGESILIELTENEETVMTDNIESQIDIEPDNDNYQALLRYHQLTGVGQLYKETLSFWV